jgi:hypothetical protein
MLIEIEKQKQFQIENKIEIEKQKQIEYQIEMKNCIEIEYQDYIFNVDVQKMIQDLLSDSDIS